MDELKKKELKVSRVNPLIRIPARLFDGIDKRKRRIPLVMIFAKDGCTIMVDRARL